ncbi:HlyD family type I secretion periplasmic adaptor subunit [Trinickia diaoshuihuensis]|uniref:HlyD family type I secretion periplasmic adaptor subunit n=1 Tax=Trinickia diaoshuihuensis TaxID=2292265 RepID=UPI000E272E51|nr:HlyD family type I secretion periplasmic adaptor subunit [Trinickia diaoshuihuensis]
MRLRLNAVFDLLRRYSAVWSAGWAARHQLDGPRKLDYELAFQPAHLELMETPVHPAPRFAARAIIALTVIVLAICVFARLDIVATAKGKLAPNARVKVIQPAITGVVREISVHDGQRVVAGQLLMKLDTTQAAADEDKAIAAKLDAALQVDRARSLLTAQQQSKAPHVVVESGTPNARRDDAQRLAEGEWHEYEDKYNAAQAELYKQEAELDGTRHQIAKLEATAPLARKQANSYKALSLDKYVAESDYLDKERTALEQEHELDAQRSHARELTAGIAEQRAQIQSIASSFRRVQLDALEKATQALTQNSNDETKAKTREALLSLTAPVAGTVQQLAVHTLGGVVTTAQSLMEIVPDDTLEAEVTVENRDVGFVSVGQRAAVKIEAFPYTRYGMLEGEVSVLSNDAVQDKKQGLVFTAHVRLKSNRMWIDKRWIALTPGMAVTAEIKTGKQTVAQYLLGPLIGGIQESLHER